MPDPALSIERSQAKKADLVLEGGGVKGIGLLGAVIALSEAGYVFPRIAGPARARSSACSWPVTRRRAGISRIWSR